MSDEKKELEVEQPQTGELDDAELGEIAGGRLRGNIVTTPTTDISDDTRRRI